MPNIEIHGLPKEQAEKVRHRIFHQLSGKISVASIVVSCVYDDPADAMDKSQPFLRVIRTKDTASEVLCKIEVALSGMGLDIEIPPPLDKFIPAK